MSHGSLSAEAHETVAIAFNRLGARSNSRRGRRGSRALPDERNSRIKQIASGRFGVTPEYAAFADELQIKIAQGSKPGEGGQLPGHKVTAEIARLRHTQPGVGAHLAAAAPRHLLDRGPRAADLRPPAGEPARRRLGEARRRGGRRTRRRGSRQGARRRRSRRRLRTAAPARARSRRSRTRASPWELGLAETQQTLVAEGLRGRVRLRVDGGMKTGRDVVAAALLGADEVSFGTALLLAEGCLMVRSCHLDTCPVGIATQRPELRAKFAATPEHVEAYLSTSPRTSADISRARLPHLRGRGRARRVPAAPRFG